MLASVQVTTSAAVAAMAATSGRPSSVVNQLCAMASCAHQSPGEPAACIPDRAWCPHAPPLADMQPAVIPGACPTYLHGTRERSSLAGHAEVRAQCRFATASCGPCCMSRSRRHFRHSPVRRVASVAPAIWAQGAGRTYLQHAAAAVRVQQPGPAWCLRRVGPTNRLQGCGAQGLPPACRGCSMPAAARSGAGAHGACSARW